MNGIKIGDRVYYVDNGPSDTGTIVDIILSNEPFVVKWDCEGPNEWREVIFPPPHVADALGVTPQSILINRSDENIDAFKGSQLRLLEE